MLPVEIHTIQDAVILRARGSELLILSEHVTNLKGRKTAKEFADYFLAEALVNRPARKLFEAWLRKDGSLWARLYKAVQTVEQSAPESTKKADAKTAETVVASKVETKKAAKTETAEKVEASKKKTEKVAAAPAKKSVAAKPEKPVKKTEAKAPAAAKKATKAAAPAKKSPTKAAGKSSGK